MQNNIRNWQSVFWLSAGLNLVGTIIFSIFAGGEELSWAKPPREENAEGGNVNVAFGNYSLN